jgi:hypothetical protein
VCFACGHVVDSSSERQEKATHMGRSRQVGEIRANTGQNG